MDDGPTTIGDAAELERVRGQARRVMRKAMLVAVVLTALAVAPP